MESHSIFKGSFIDQKVLFLSTPFRSTSQFVCYSELHSKDVAAEYPIVDLRKVLGHYFQRESLSYFLRVEWVELGSVFLELSKRKGFHRRANSRDISGLMNYPIYEDFYFRMKQIRWSESIESGVVRMIAPAGNRFMPNGTSSLVSRPGRFLFYFLDPLV